jgi:hypothetical protein
MSAMHKEDTHLTMIETSPDTAGWTGSPIPASMIPSFGWAAVSQGEKLLRDGTSLQADFFKFTDRLISLPPGVEYMAIVTLVDRSTEGERDLIGTQVEVLNSIRALQANVDVDDNDQSWGMRMLREAGFQPVTHPGDRTEGKEARSAIGGYPEDSAADKQVQEESQCGDGLCTADLAIPPWDGSPPKDAKSLETSNVGECVQSGTSLMSQPIGPLDGDGVGGRRRTVNDGDDSRERPRAGDADVTFTQQVSSGTSVHHDPTTGDGSHSQAPFTRTYEVLIGPETPKSTTMKATHFRSLSDSQDTQLPIDEHYWPIKWHVADCERPINWLDTARERADVEAVSKIYGGANGGG